MQEENKKEEIQNNEGGIEGDANIDQGYQEEGRENTKLKLVALFVVAVLVGVVIKAQAVKIVTTGFDDYRLSGFESDFDLEKDQEALLMDSETGQQGEEATVVEPEAPAPSCGN